MSDTPINNTVESDSDILVRWNQQMESVSLTEITRLLYLQRASETKDKIDILGAEINLRQDKVRFINDLICDINNLTNDENGCDLTALQDKLSIAKELGVNISTDKLTLNSLERDRMIQNLHLTGEGWDKENRSETQKMEVCVKELDRIMMLLKEIQKSEDKPKRSSLAGIKGG